MYLNSWLQFLRGLLNRMFIGNTEINTVMQQHSVIPQQTTVRNIWQKLTALVKHNFVFRHFNRRTLNQALALITIY